jgi:hypothetical protein
MGARAPRACLRRAARAAAITCPCLAPATVKYTAKKRFGQHFLTDLTVINAIVDTIAPRPGQALVEIGPGLGAMTNPLVAPPSSSSTATSPPACANALS